MDPAGGSKRPRVTSDANTPPKRKAAVPRKEGSACAECRRLKHRCNRVFPCESCIKRGCAQICPNGSLTTGKGNRFVLAGSEELHVKIASLSDRIRFLEDALCDAHTQVSSSPHPLLSEELLKIKSPMERPYISEEDNPDDGNSVSVDAFGSLSIGESGRAKFYGQPANSWYFLQIEDEDDSFESAMDRDMTQELFSLGRLFPFCASPADRIAILQTNIFERLPPEQRALRLIDEYFEKAAWLHNPISRPEVEEIMKIVYRPPTDQGDPFVTPHKLAALLLVFATGTLMADDEMPYSSLAEKYHQLARAAMGLEGVFDSPTLIAVQALCLMAIYLFFSDKAGSGGTRWAVTGIAVKLAQSIGLHRDSARFNLATDDASVRRKVFWELFAYDSMQSITFGRPPSFSLAHIDCKMLDEPGSEGPEPEISFHGWKHRFVKECLTMVHDQCFGGRTPTYTTIQKIDAKIRSFYVPPSLRIAGFHAGAIPGSDSGDLSLCFQRHVLHGIRETILLYMHRNFLVRAMNDSPADPLKSPFGGSVLCAYRCACSLIASTRGLHRMYPETLARVWFIWSHVFSAAVVLGSIVTKCPGIALAPSALHQLKAAVEMFEQASGCLSAEKTLPMMQDILRRSEGAFANFRGGLQRSYSKDEQPFVTEGTDPLTLLGGGTRLVSPKSKPRNESKSASPPSDYGEYNPPPYAPSQTTNIQVPVTSIPNDYAYLLNDTRGTSSLQPATVPSYYDPGPYHVPDLNTNMGDIGAYPYTMGNNVTQWTSPQPELEVNGTLPGAGVDLELTWQNFVAGLQLYDHPSTASM